MHLNITIFDTTDSHSRHGNNKVKKVHQWNAKTQTHATHPYTYTGKKNHTFIFRAKRV